MNFYKTFTRTVKNQKEVTAITAYKLTWRVAYHDFSSYYKVEKKDKVFTSREDAEAYAKGLKEAYKFLKLGYGLGATLVKLDED